MTYRWELDTGQQISIDNRGSQTIVSVLSIGSGQQQQTSNSFTTGTWISPPEMTIDPSGCSVKIVATNGESWVRIQGDRIQVSGSTGNNSSSSSSSSSTVASKLEPLPPMHMGDMQMSMQPMQMRMGNMELNMSAPINAAKFCTQCGVGVKSVDRFCASCGHKLDD